MLRWNETQLLEYSGRHQQTRKDALNEAREHVVDRPRPKYRNHKTTIGGVVFDSKLEAARYIVLRQMQEIGIVSNLKTQVRFKLIINDLLVCTYIADFTYTDSDGRDVVEDTKGMRTDTYILKKKLMRAVLGIEIHEVRKERRYARKP